MSMYRRRGWAGLVALAMAAAAIASAGGAVAAGLTVSAGQASYAPGTTVTLSGSTGSASVPAVALEVNDPAGNHAFVDQVTPDSQGNFSDSFVLAASAALGTYRVYAMAAAGLSGQTNFTVATPSPAGLSIPSTSLPGGTVGSSYSVTLQATGGTAPYTWSVTQGSLPAGLSLRSGGTISGTPTTAGTSSFTAQVTDSASNTAAANLGMTVVNSSVSVTGTSSASTSSSSTPATAGGTGSNTPNTTATASDGTGSVTVESYSGNPGPTPTFSSAGAYFDVSVSVGSSFTSVTITQCSLSANSDQLYWRNGTTWTAVSPAATFDSGTGCLTFTAQASGTSPGVADLTATPFAVGTSFAPGGGGSPGGGGGAAMAVPTVTGISPTGGPASGGTVLTITGTNFIAPLTVAFGPNAATSVQVRSSTDLTAVSPADSGTVDVTVTTPYGTTATSSADRFSYSLPTSQTVAAAPSSFSDVPAGYWAYADIETLAAKGIVAGFPDGTFAPDAAVTRAQFVKMLALTVGLKPAAGATPFSDVAASDWFAPYVSAGMQAGIVQGLSTTGFGPNETVTREQMAVLLARALKLTKTATLQFKDDTQIDAWATAGTEEAVAAGYINGFPNGTFQPLGTTTRAQAAKVLALVLSQEAAATGTTSTSSRTTTGVSGG